MRGSVRARIGVRLRFRRGLGFGLGLESGRSWRAKDRDRVELGLGLGSTHPRDIKVGPHHMESIGSRVINRFQSHFICNIRCRIGV
jgi:hypothetical protein